MKIKIILYIKIALIKFLFFCKKFMLDENYHGVLAGVSAFFQLGKWDFYNNIFDLWYPILLEMLNY